MAARRGPGRLRRGGLQGPRRGHQGQVPDGHLPALQRRAHPGLLGRDGRARLPRAPQRLRVRRRRTQEGGLRQHHRGRQARRRGGEESGLFRRFAAHYGLDYTFTNPYSGNEKGNVENKVGCHRRNLFVPVPSFHDARAFNRRLLEDCLDLSEGKPTTGSARPSPSCSERTGRRSRRCRRRHSRARGGRPGGATSRERSRSAGRTATRPAPPTRAARSPSPSAPSTSRSATARPGRSSPPTSASGARPRPTARTRRRG